MIPWLSLVLLLLVLPIYLIVEYKSKVPWDKLVLKTICSLLFLAAAVAAMLGAPGGWQGWYGLFAAAFLLSLLGDVLLAVPVKQSFLSGLGAFFMAQCCFAAAFIGRWGLSPLDIATYAVLAGTAILTLMKMPGMEYGKLMLPVCVYALALSAMAAKAVSGAYINGGMGAWAAAAGGLLFYASDVILSFICFHKKKVPCLRALNLITYYVGQGLLALSLYLS